MTKKALKTKAGKKSDKKSKGVVSTIPFSGDDYLVIKYNNKPALGLVIGPKRLLLEKGVEEDDSTVVTEFKPEDVIANLGKNPEVGKVFNIQVEPYQRTVQIPDWGQLRIYRSGVKKSEKNTLFAAFKKAAAILTKQNALGFVKSMSHLELRSRGGKWAGTYKYVRTKDDAAKDVISINNIPLDDEAYLIYVLLHEASHGIWFRQVPKTIKAKWLSLYAKRITVKSFGEKRMQKLVESIVKYDGSINDYMREMADEEEILIIKEAIAHIRKVHKLDRFDLDLIHDSGDKERLHDLWPKLADIGNPTYDPTEYALTNPKEFFAECLSYYLVGRKLSKDLMVACEKTLEKLTRY